MKRLTVNQLRQLLRYNKRTGVFTWRVAGGRRIAAGMEAGRRNSRLYRYIGIHGRKHLAQRLAVLYVTGKWPRHVIAFRNGDPLDCRWSNLVARTQLQNHRSRRKPNRNSKVGVRGVRRASSKKIAFQARIQVDGKGQHLGTFSSVAEASLVYLIAQGLLRESE